MTSQVPSRGLVCSASILRREDFQFLALNQPWYTALLSTATTMAKR